MTTEALDRLRELDAKGGGTMLDRLKSPPLAYDACGGREPSPVRVSYFDPRTGLPCDEKPEPLRRDGVYFMGGSKNAKPVLVDGVRYASVTAAAKAVGCSAVTLRKYLRSGAASCRGHEVAYAEGGVR